MRLWVIARNPLNRQRRASSRPSAAWPMCWDIFSKGFCPRQGQGECRWQHPMCTAVVEVKVAFLSRQRSTPIQISGAFPRGHDSIAHAHRGRCPLAERVCEFVATESNLSLPVSFFQLEALHRSRCAVFTQWIVRHF